MNLGEDVRIFVFHIINSFKSSGPTNWAKNVKNAMRISYKLHVRHVSPISHPWVILGIFFLHISVNPKVTVCHAVTFNISSNAYVDIWDRLNNFCFHVYAQK